MNHLKQTIAKTFPLLREWKHRFENAGKQKVFCIGMSKTGTTSLAKAFRDLGYRIGSEAKTYPFYHNYAVRDFKPLVNYCKTAQVFEDELFGLPFTFQALDHAFPESKFILSIRDNPEQWYASFINHQIRAFGKNGKLPTSEDLQQLYKTPGLNRLEYQKLRFNTPENNIFSKEIMIEAYQNHIKTVQDYFRYREKDLLIINLSEKHSYSQFCSFLGVEPLYDRFPHLNKGVVS